MKYLKQYEELNIETYKKVADKLKDYGHNRRSDVMMQHYKTLLPLKVKKEWEQLLQDYSKYGKLKIEFKNDYSTGSGDSHLLECNFRIKYDFKNNIGIEDIIDNLSSNNDAINIKLDVYIIPSNEEDFEFMKKMFQFDSPITEYRLFTFNIRLLVSQNNWVVSDMYLITTSLGPRSLSFQIIDRGSAGRLASIFKKAFDRDCVYPANDYETLYDEINRVIFIEPGLSSEIGISIEDIRKYVHNNLKANDLFQY